jgi:hypothetical protein
VGSFTFEEPVDLVFLNKIRTISIAVLVPHINEIGNLIPCPVQFFKS